MDEFKMHLLASHLVEAFAVNAEVEAMKAENQSREYRGETQAYPEDVFIEKAVHLWSLSAAIRSNA